MPPSGVKGKRRILPVLAIIHRFAFPAPSVPSAPSAVKKFLFLVSISALYVLRLKPRFTHLRLSAFICGQSSPTPSRNRRGKIMPPPGANRAKITLNMLCCLPPHAFFPMFRACSRFHVSGPPLMASAPPSWPFPAGYCRPSSHQPSPWTLSGPMT